MKIFNGKNLLIPLYHGTSTLFLDDIKKHGFGGKNLIDEMKVMDMLTQLYESCISETNFKHEDPVTDQLCKNILSQNEGWQYKSLYLNTSKYKAYNHSLLYKYGSEILSVTMYLYEYMTYINPGYQFHNRLHNELAGLLLEADIQPVVLQLNHMDIDILCRGGDKESILLAIYKLQEFYNRFGENACDLLQMNFTLPYGIPIKQDNFIIYEDVSDINNIKGIEIIT